MARLDGARVALLEARRSGELAALVCRFGGVPRPVPAVREVPHLDHVPAFLDRLCSGRVSMAICLTGSAVSRLLDEARRLGRLPAVEAALRGVTTVCRGPKPASVLRQHDIPVAIRAGAPHTTTELLDALVATELTGRSIAVLHYGERNERLSDALRRRGGALHELCLYEWRMPQDVEPLASLVCDAIEGHVDALAVTSQIQIRHLLDIARARGMVAPFVAALNERVIVAAIGPVCVAALHTHGITPRVVPPQAKMGHLVTALAEYVERTRP